MLVYLVLGIYSLFLLDNRSKSVNKNGNWLHFTKFDIWPKYDPKPGMFFSKNPLPRFSEISNDRVLYVNKSKIESTL